MDVFLIKDSVIENCISADSTERAQQFYPDYTCIERTELLSQFGIGDLYNAGVFTKSPPKPPILYPISRLTFLRRFTAQQRIAIRAQEDAVIKDALQMLDLAEEVKLDDQDTVFFVNYLVTQNLITEEDSLRILGVV